MRLHYVEQRYFKVSFIVRFIELLFTTFARSLNNDVYAPTISELVSGTYVNIFVKILNVNIDVSCTDRHVKRQYQN